MNGIYLIHPPKNKHVNLVEFKTYFICSLVNIACVLSDKFCLLWSNLRTPGVNHFSSSLLQIHLNLLIMEARLQAELLYALRAITQYMIA